VLPDGADAKSWYVSLSRARRAMHVYTRDKAALRQSVVYPGERKSVWELVQALRRSKPRSRDRIMPDLWAGAPSGNRSRDGNGTLDLLVKLAPIRGDSFAFNRCERGTIEKRLNAKHITAFARSIIQIKAKNGGHSSPPPPGNRLYFVGVHPSRKTQFPA
jgi:hypothetical protein